MSNITDRGTLKGTIYRGAGTGTTDYTELNNKPQINGNTLQGNQTGHDLGLANYTDIPTVPTIEINKAGPLPSTILKSIHLNGEGYRNYLQFVGASPGNNGEAGIVPKPLGIGYDDYKKFLRGDAQWASVKECIDYSTNEQDTGIKWVDGKTIYSKTFYIQQNSGYIQFTDIDYLWIDYSNTFLKSSSTKYTIYPFYFGIRDYFYLFYNANTQVLNYNALQDNHSDLIGYITVRYTKQ